jgi:hypothetical protein
MYQQNFQNNGYYQNQQQFGGYSNMPINQSGNHFQQPHYQQQLPTVDMLRNTIIQNLVTYASNSLNSSSDYVRTANNTILTNNGNNQNVIALASIGAVFLLKAVTAGRWSLDYGLQQVVALAHWFLIGEAAQRNPSFRTYHNPQFLQQMDQGYNDWMRLMSEVQGQPQQQNVYGQANQFSQSQVGASLGGGQPSMPTAASGFYKQPATNAPQAQDQPIYGNQVASSQYGNKAEPDIYELEAEARRIAMECVQEGKEPPRALNWEEYQEQLRLDKLNGIDRTATTTTTQQEQPPFYKQPANPQVNAGGGSPMPKTTVTRMEAPVAANPTAQQYVNPYAGAVPLYGTMKQEVEGVGEVDITFKKPQYVNTPMPEPAPSRYIPDSGDPEDNAADEMFRETFGDMRLESQLNSLHLDPTTGLDREDLARAGVISHGPASSNLHNDPFDHVEDSFTAVHYTDAVLKANPNLAAQEQADLEDMFPGCAGLSLMELATGRKFSDNGGVTMKTTPKMPEMAPEERTDISNMVLEDRVKELVGGIAPVYIAGRQRPVLLKSLGGGRIVMETSDVDYAIHETEILAGATSVALDGRPGNPKHAAEVLTKALVQENEKHFLKVIKDKLEKEEEISEVLVDGPMYVMDNLVISSGVDEWAACAQAELTMALGEHIEHINLDASINFNAFNPGKYILLDETLESAQAIIRAKTATTIAERIEDFFDACNLPAREIHRIAKAMTKEVNRGIAVTFSPEYTVDSATLDLEELATVMNEEGFEDVTKKLYLIYAQSAKVVFATYTAAALKRRLANVEDETGLSEGNNSAIFADVTNVTLLPLAYADYPLSFKGDYGRITKDTLPKLYEVLSGILSKRIAEGVYKFAILTEDHQLIEFFKPVLTEDESIYLARG